MSFSTTKSRYDPVINLNCGYKIISQINKKKLWVGYLTCAPFKFGKNAVIRFIMQKVEVLAFA